MSDCGLVDLHRAERFVHVHFGRGTGAAGHEREKYACSQVRHVEPPNLIDKRPLVGYR